MLKKFFLLGIGSLIFVSCSTTEGIIRDEDTKMPIASAVITNTRLNKSATTNAVGYYSIYCPAIPGDVFMINAPGYNMTTATKKLSFGQIEFLDIEMVKNK